MGRSHMALTTAMSLSLPDTLAIVVIILRNPYAI